MNDLDKKFGTYVTANDFDVDINSDMAVQKIVQHDLLSLLVIL